MDRFTGRQEVYHAQNRGLSQLVLRQKGTGLQMTC